MKKIKLLFQRRSLFLVTLIVVVVLALIMVFFIPRRDKSAIDVIVDAKAEPQFRYGIQIDSLILHENFVRPRESLSVILDQFGVSAQRIDQVVRASRGVFDLRQLKAGNKYTVLSTADSLEVIQYFIYQYSPIQYVVFDLRDAVKVYTGEKQVERRTEMVSGIIESSLWNSITAQGANPQLALELSEIYAWSIDFFAIQKGDAFRVQYENLIVEGKPIGIGRILSAVFRHGGEDFYAFYFVQGDKGDYFDENGNSLRKTFLKAPLKFSRISSHFSHRRLHPIHRVYRPHHGVDYAAPTGTPVMAIGDGKVTVARYRGASGNMVEIVHNSVYKTQYLHLSRFGRGIRPGVRVKQGQVIGYVGSTGSSTGPHLCFRFYQNGRPVNPLRVESPPAEPVKQEYRLQYDQHVVEMLKVLNANQS
ncbi:MAG TPA: peptidoglycan DD-metalloendopeptidase family protein [Bacteroidales bacterium]|nr:peptidoglycan DD-metalloendopeptidase family protein [Bacteroidales bacterium]